MKKDNAAEITGIGHKGDGSKENPHVARDFGPQPNMEEVKKHMREIGLDAGGMEVTVSIGKKGKRQSHGFRYLTIFWLGAIWIGLADTIGKVEPAKTYGFWEVLWTGIVIGAFAFGCFMAGRESKN